mgnify:FL=1
MIEIESMSFGEDFIVFNLEDSDEIKIKHADLKNLSEDDDILLISRFGFGYKPIKCSFYKSLDKNMINFIGFKLHDKDKAFEDLFANYF